MNNVFLYRMPVGIAGAVSRPQDLTVEPVVLKSDNAFAAYGLAGKYDDDGFFVPLADGDTADKVKGIYVRPYQLRRCGYWCKSEWQKLGRQRLNRYCWRERGYRQIR